tara:strand:+ start:147 stop:431 length:285 start_codon:yes stop_codon:yes gene_type:complete
VIIQNDQKKNLIKGTNSKGTFCSKPKGSKIAHSNKLLKKIPNEMFSSPVRKVIRYRKGTKLSQTIAISLKYHLVRKSNRADMRNLKPLNIFFHL